MSMALTFGVCGAFQLLPVAGPLYNGVVIRIIIHHVCFCVIKFDGFYQKFCLIKPMRGWGEGTCLYIVFSLELTAGSAATSFQCLPIQGCVCCLCPSVFTRKG